MARKRPTSQKFRERHPREVGKFYHHDDKNGGHPSRVYKSDAKNDTYLIQKFSTKCRKGRERLTHNIDPENVRDEQWITRKPEAVGFDDLKYLGKYKNYRVHPDDLKTVKKYQKFNIKRNKKNR